ncbi:MAG TPA: hypothetical protein VHT91_28930 [Kofleriaceae bacterium]|jgi:hypothetical protein|nr:hypothetical protein [Kofleriaceae bacterium]
MSKPRSPPPINGRDRRARGDGAVPRSAAGSVLAFRRELEIAVDQVVR